MNKFAHSCASSVATIVLAGGRATRLGGADKAAVRWRGKSFIQHLCEGVAALAGVTPAWRFGPVVVVGPPRVQVEGAWCAPLPLFKTCEEPAFGGPVAGISAGLGVLAKNNQRANWVFVVSVDAPQAAQILPALLLEAAALHRATAAGSHRGEAVAEPMAIIPVGTEGYAQRLCALYRRSALEQALAALPAVRNVSVRRALGDLPAQLISDTAGKSQDYDTWEQIQTLP